MRSVTPEAIGLAGWLVAALVAGAMALGVVTGAGGGGRRVQHAPDTGKRVGSEREPLQGVAVEARGEFGEDTFGPWSALPTNAEGNFEIEVPDGTFRLHLSLESTGSGACFLGYFGSDGRRARYGQVERVVLDPPPERGGRSPLAPV